jgi:uncharacterized protein (TIGR02118 family)
MLKIMFCLRRLPGMSREEFQRYWREVHAPLVARHAAVLNIVRYVQSHTGDDAGFARLSATRGGAPAYDGVAELWIAEADVAPDARRQALASAANQALLEDERRFIDLPNSPIFHVREFEALP